MSVLSTQWAHLALADGTDVVKLSIIGEGVDGASFFVLTPEAENIRIEENQTHKVADAYTLEARVLRSSAAATQLDTWAGSGVRLQATLTSVDSFAVIPELSISVHEQLSTVDVLVITASITTTGRGFHGGQRNVAVGNNLLGRWNLLGFVADVMNGFTVPAGIAVQSAGIIQTMERDTGSSLAESGLVLWPYPGRQLRAVMQDVTKLGDYEFGVRFYEADETLISTSLNTASPTGTAQHTATVPADTAFVSFVVGPSDSGGDAVNFSRPQLRIQVGTTFVQ